MTEYESWMRKVDQAVSAKAGLSVYDLSDQNYYEWYEAGVKPTTAANRALKAEGFRG